MADSHTTILGKGSSFEGKLTFEGTVRIDGHFTGEIHTEGTLIVGEGAVVVASIQAGSVVAQGEIRGDVTASQSLAIMAPARVLGNVDTPGLTIEQGAFFEGSCKMSGSQGPETPAPAPAPA